MRLMECTHARDREAGTGAEGASSKEGTCARAREKETARRRQRERDRCERGEEGGVQEKTKKRQSWDMGAESSSTRGSTYSCYTELGYRMKVFIFYQS